VQGEALKLKGIRLQYCLLAADRVESIRRPTRHRQVIRLE